MEIQPCESSSPSRHLTSQPANARHLMMVFLSICTALYDYTPQDDNELAIKQGELIFILEKSAGDDWWKAKKRAPGEAEEPVGLIPYNYVEEVSRHSFSSTHAMERRKRGWEMQERQCINTGHLPPFRPGLTSILRHNQFSMQRRCMSTQDKQTRSFLFPTIRPFSFTTQLIQIGPWLA